MAEGNLLVDSEANFSPEVAHALCYMTSGKNAGDAREIYGWANDGAYPILRVADYPFEVRGEEVSLPHTIPISNVAELQAIEDNLSGNYYLTQDIDASATESWNEGLGFAPISLFQGTLDGCGFTISGLHINRPTTNYVGLFGRVRGYSSNGGRIANLVLEDCHISGASYVGTLAGQVSSYSIYGAIVQNCQSSGTIEKGSQGFYYFGGLVGYVVGSSSTVKVQIEDCIADVEVNLEETFQDSPDSIGGLIGYVGNGVYITNSRALGNVVAYHVDDDDKYGSNIGGFIGTAAGTTAMSILDCTATGDVEGGDAVGGFVGAVYGLPGVERCSARGDVVGWSEAVQSSGGFACTVGNVYGTAGSLKNCYSWGSVTDPTSTGSFVAHVYYAESVLENCYSIGEAEGKGFVTTNNGEIVAVQCFWDTLTTGTEESALGEGHDTTWMQTKSNFEDAEWDMETIWYMPESGEGGTRPTQLQFVEPFRYPIEKGDTYAISAVPWRARMWYFQHPQVSKFNRWNVEGVSIKSRAHEGFTDNPNNFWRAGAYRSMGRQEPTVAYPTVSQNPSESSAKLPIEGIKLTPFLEQIAVGVMFEVTDAEFTLTLTDSREVG